MDRINGPNYALDANGNRVFQGRNPVTGQPGTVFTAIWCTGLQEEVMSVLGAASIVPNAANNAQLLAAILALIKAAGAGSASGGSDPGGGLYAAMSNPAGTAVRLVQPTGSTVLQPWAGGTNGMQLGFTLTLPPTWPDCHVIAVGGGGGGGDGNGQAGGGGGSGAFVWQHAAAPAGPLNGYVGLGGAANMNGASSGFFGLAAGGGCAGGKGGSTGFTGGLFGQPYGPASALLLAGGWGQGGFAVPGGVYFGGAGGASFFGPGDGGSAGTTTFGGSGVGGISVGAGGAGGAGPSTGGANGQGFGLPGQPGLVIIWR